MNEEFHTINEAYSDINISLVNMKSSIKDLESEIKSACEQNEVSLKAPDLSLANLNETENDSLINKLKYAYKCSKFFN